MSTKLSDIKKICSIFAPVIFSTFKATMDVSFLKKNIKTDFLEKKLDMFQSYVYCFANYDLVESKHDTNITKSKIQIKNSQIIITDANDYYHKRFVIADTLIKNINGYNNDTNFDTDICEEAAYIFNCIQDEIDALDKQ